MKKNALLIGAFVLIALALIVAGIITLGGRGLFSTQLKAVVYFEGNVRGLYVGAPVTFRGVKIGDVEGIRIEVDPRTLAARIPVNLILGTDMLRMGGPDGQRMSNLPDLVRKGLRAKLILQSVVTGQTGIDLDFKPDTPLHLVAGGRGKVPEIPAMHDKLDALLEQISTLPLSDLVKDMRRTMDTLDKTLKAAQIAVTGASAQLQATGVQADKTLVIGAQALQALQAQSTTTLKSIQRLSDTSRDVVLHIQPDLTLTLQSTREAAQTAQAAMAQVAELSAPGAPLRADLETAMRDISHAARSMRAFSDELEREPSTLIFGKGREP
jgi:paraquat-inducible protein B